MSLFWYPELNEKYTFEEAPDKGMLLTSYINYFLARLQSMFIYDGLPDTIPQKWLENYLLVNGSCVWVKNGEDLIVTRAGVGGEPDVYYIPTKCIVANPYALQSTNRTYTRDVDCVLMVNDTYAQGLLPLLKKYCSMLVENEITMNLAIITARATITMSAADDETKASAELWLKRLTEGRLGIIGEAPFLVGNQDRALTVNNISGASSTLTDLIETQQYIKACLYNDIGLQSNYNMKREAINSNESQLNEDMLHPLIDTMLRERQEGLERVNEMFGTNITVRFNSAWEINEREEEAAIEQIEATADQTVEVTDNDTEIPADDNTDDNGIDNSNDAEPNEAEGVEDNQEEAEPVEVTITEEAIEEIAEAVAEKLEEYDNETDETAE